MRSNLKLLVLTAIGLMTLGCDSTAPKNALDIQEERSRDPLVMEYTSGSEATAWLMDMKHTLRGYDLEATQNLCQELLKRGADELRVSDIQPDPQDGSYLSAGKLLIKLSKNPKARTDVIQLVGQLQGIPIDDSGQDLIVLVFPLGK